MRIFKFFILGLLILMSLAAGFAKMSGIPQEVAFFEAVGLSQEWMKGLATFQIMFAVIAMFPKERKKGLLMMGASFLVSAIMIFMSGDIGFGIGSLLPVAAALLLAFSPWGAEIHPSK